MRVRNLLECLSDQNLVHCESLTKYRGEEFIYIDAGWFFKGIDGLMDPSVNIMESYSSSIPLKVNQILGKLDYYDIKAVFVFQGILYKHNINILADVNLSRVNSYNHMMNPDVEFNSNYDLDQSILFLIYKHLKASRRCVVQAPYLAPAQISLFNKKGLCNIAISSPSLLLFDVKTVITDIDLDNGTCSVAYLPEILTKFNVNLDQFIDASILSGTEYSFTIKPLDKPAFKFLDSIELVKKDSFNNLIESESLEQYVIAKQIVVNSLVFDRGIKLLPINSNFDPNIFGKLAGSRVADCLYNMLYCGLISPNLLYTLSNGCWMELPDPHVKTDEYRELLDDLRDCHLRSIEIISAKLPKNFQKRDYNFVQIADKAWNKFSVRRFLTNGTRGKLVRITSTDVNNELMRQNVRKISILFCIRWHLHCINSKTPLAFDLDYIEKSLHDENSLCCLAIFMFLDNLGYFTIEGGATVYGLALSKISEKHQINGLIALEMLKYGIFTGEQLSTNDAVSESSSVKLMCRLASLFPIQLKGKWGFKPHLEISAFNSLIKLLSVSMATLFDACIANIIIDSKVLLTKIMYVKDELYSAPSIMGVVFKHFLEYKSNRGIRRSGNLSPRRLVAEQSELEQSLNDYFPSLIQPLEAITSTVKMIISIHGLLTDIGNKSDSCLLNEFSMAKKFMLFQMQKYALDTE